LEKNQSLKTRHGGLLQYEIEMLLKTNQPALAIAAASF